MKKSRKVFCTIFAIVLAISSVLTSYAYQGDITENSILDGLSCEIAVPTLYNDKSDLEILENVAGVDVEKLEEHILTAVTNHEQTISLEEFNISISSDVFDALSAFIFEEIEEAFHVNTFAMWKSSTKYLYIEPKYFYDEAEYKGMMDECNKVTEKIIDGVKDNNNLSDAEKALIIHDRLSVICSYDHDAAKLANAEDPAFSMYGALVEGSAVCQGYSEAYNYLLKKVGIKSHLCTSDALVHAWNIVYIDGKPYHVDVTWDDGEVNGSVYHNYFLLSTDALYKGVNGGDGHVANDYDKSPVSTKYDNYYWQNSTTAFQLIDNEIYYIDNEAKQLIRESDGKVLCSVEDRWLYDSDYSYWPGNYSKLSSDGKNLLYTDTENVYKYNLETNRTTVVFSPDLSVGSYYSIFGMAYDGKYIVCDLFNSPNVDTENLMKHDKKAYSVGDDIIVGDVNGDGEVNSKDVTVIGRALSGGWNIAIDYEIFDCDENGSFNAKDVSMVRRIAAGGW